MQNPLEMLHENVLVAVHIQGYKKPVIGKVISVKDGSTLDFKYVKGSQRKERKQWKLPTGENRTDNLPNGCVLLVDFHVDKENRLVKETYKYLRKTSGSGKKSASQMKSESCSLPLSCLIL